MDTAEAFCEPSEERTSFLHVLLPLLLAIGGVSAAASVVSAEGEAEAPEPPFAIEGIFSSRTRFEVVDFFRSTAPGIDTDYTFFANRTRFGAKITGNQVEAVAVGQYTKLWSLPDRAIGLPGGPAGIGGVYWAHNLSEGPDSVGVKYAFLKMKEVMGEPLSVQVGRFGYTSAVERPSGNEKLEKLKTIRLSERLYGEFGFSHFTRSFDGIRLDWDNEYGRFTAFGFRPTQGGFERDINERINDIDVAGGALTWKADLLSMPTEFQFFYSYYDDERPVAARVDNLGGAVTR